MEEEWRSVIGFEGVYEVSNLGRVKRVLRTSGTRHDFMTPTPDSTGRLFVNLRYHKQRKNAQVHRLVLTAFMGPCPSGLVACHNDGNPSNNNLNNLRWDTQSSNMADRWRHGTVPCGAKSHLAKLSEAQARYVLARRDLSTKNLAQIFDVDQATIRRIRRGATWKHL